MDFHENIKKTEPAQIIIKMIISNQNNNDCCIIVIFLLVRVCELIRLNWNPFIGRLYIVMPLGNSIVRTLGLLIYLWVTINDAVRRTGNGNGFMS